MKVEFEISDIAGNVVQDLQGCLITGVVLQKGDIKPSKFNEVTPSTINKHIDRAIHAIIKDDIRGQQPKIVDVTSF